MTEWPPRPLGSSLALDETKDDDEPNRNEALLIRKGET